MTKTLTGKTKKELSELARRRGIAKPEALSKDQLLQALDTPMRPKSSAKPAAKAAPKPTVKPASKLTTKPAPAKAVPAVPAPTAKPVPARPAPVAAKVAAPAVKPPVAKVPALKPPPSKHAAPPPIPAAKDLSARGKANVHKDQIWLMVSDPFWLHACWELSAQAVQRAEAALGQDWHGARPVIRLFDVTSVDTTSTSETPVRDIVVQGGCNHWYIDVPQPPRSYRADIGYLSRRGEFKPLARSNAVTPPKAGSSEDMSDNWPPTDLDESAADRILAMSTGFESSGGPSQLRELFDEQFRRGGKDTTFGSGAVLPDKLKKFAFDLTTELIVHGRTDPSAHVTLQNEPVKLRADGSFTMRYALTDGRQIIPAVATAADGMEERTIVLAVERNTKHLDPMVHDLYAEN